MSYRLSNIRVRDSRKVSKVKKVRAKILFFVEGAKTEIIYLQALKKYIPQEKNIDVEILDRWKDLSGESNQLNIVKRTKEYLDSCQGLGKRKRNQIEQVLEKLEYSEWSLEEMQVILNNIRRILGDELLSSREILKTQLQSIKTCFNFDKEKDRICFVLDRDYSSFSENQYDEVIEICKEENFDLGITSPNFEFYLLLHLIPLNNENRDKIFMNVDNFSEKRMKEAMFEMFGEIYKKEKYNADLIINRFNDYKVHIEAYSTNPKELKSKVGSSLGTIIEELIKYSNISSSS